jgi:hypothetical protein
MCSSSTTIKVTHVSSPPLFHDPSSYMRARCATAATAQSSLCVKSSSIVCFSLSKSTIGSKERNPHNNLSMVTAIRSEATTASRRSPRTYTNSEANHHRLPPRRREPCPGLSTQNRIAGTRARKTDHCPHSRAPRPNQPRHGEGGGSKPRHGCSPPVEKAVITGAAAIHLGIAATIG